jgi:hypothetical protein
VTIPALTVATDETELRQVTAVFAAPFTTAVNWRVFAGGSSTKVAVSGTTKTSIKGLSPSPVGLQATSRVKPNSSPTNPDLCAIIWFSMLNR